MKKLAIYIPFLFTMLATATDVQQGLPEVTMAHGVSSSRFVISLRAILWSSELELCAEGPCAKQLTN